MVKKLLVLLIFVLAIAGCGNTQDSAESPEENFEIENYSMQKHVVEEKDGYEMEVVQINHTEEVDFFKRWQERNKKREEQAKYEMVRDIYERKDREIREEETELKRYCDSLHSNSCLDMEWIKDHNGCRKVEVTCEENDTEDICIEYEVDVKSKLYPEDEC